MTLSDIVSQTCFFSIELASANSFCTVNLLKASGYSTTMPLLDAIFIDYPKQGVHHSIEEFGAFDLTHSTSSLSKII